MRSTKTQHFIITFSFFRNSFESRRSKYFDCADPFSLNSCYIPILWKVELVGLNHKKNSTFKFESWNDKCQYKFLYFFFCYKIRASLWTTLIRRFEISKSSHRHKGFSLNMKNFGTLWFRFVIIYIILERYRNVLKIRKNGSGTISIATSWCEMSFSE